MNGCFIIKRELGPRNISLDAMPWPRDSPGFDGHAFRSVLEEYAGAMEALSLMLLPAYASALRLAPDYFDAAFKSPLYRLRAAHYPATPPGEFGINAHVDSMPRPRFGPVALAQAQTHP